MIDLKSTYSHGVSPSRSQHDFWGHFQGCGIRSGLVRDQVTGRIVDGLRVIAAASSQKSPWGDLPNSLLQPAGIQMTFQLANQVCGHDSYGFTRRLLPEGVCDTFPPAN